MKLNTIEQGTQCSFDYYCKKAMKNEVRRYYKTENLRLKNETTFSELPEQKLVQLSMMDEYVTKEQNFKVLNCNVIVKDEDIAKALLSLPEQQRKIILLYYYLDFSDVEIGQKLNLARSTTQYLRTNALQELKNYLGEVI